MKNMAKCAVYNYRYVIARCKSTEVNRRYCRDQVRKQDYEGYLIGLLFPKELQSSYFAIKAYNVEVATIRDQTRSDPKNISRIRFQYWREILNDIHTNRKLKAEVNSPVALELCESILKHNLTIRLLERNLEARLVFSELSSNDDITCLLTFLDMLTSQIIAHMRVILLLKIMRSFLILPSSIFYWSYWELKEMILL
jgi:NADH dehydrogenase [ubiquinone] 1 alpha subcomplex assembly factor 6